MGAVERTCFNSRKFMAVLGENLAFSMSTVSWRKTAVVIVEIREIAAAKRAGAANPHWERNPPMAGPNIKPIPKAAPRSPMPFARVFLSVTSAM